MQMHPYVSFPGTCEVALSWYAQIFGGTTEFHRYGGTPMESQVPDNERHFIMHGKLTTPDFVLMGSDQGSGLVLPPAGSVRLSINTDDVEQGRGYFDKLAQGATVEMRFGPTFWAAGFGMLTDKFGVAWMVDCSAAKRETAAV